MSTMFARQADPKLQEDQVVEEGLSDVEDDESFFQDVDILQNHGIVSN